MNLSKSAFWAQKFSLASRGRGRRGVHSFLCRPSAHSEGMRRVQLFLALNFFVINRNRTENLQIRKNVITIPPWEYVFCPVLDLPTGTTFLMVPGGRRGPDAQFGKFERFEPQSCTFLTELRNMQDFSHFDTFAHGPSRNLGISIGFNRHSALGIPGDYFCLELCIWSEWHDIH